LGLYKIISKKLNIKIIERTPFSYYSKTRKWVEISFIVILLVVTALLAFSATDIPPFKSHYYIAFMPIIFSFFHAFMEWKYEKDAKQYVLSILAGIFFIIVFLGVELVFTNPVPVRLNADQVTEISVEVISESGSFDTIILTDKESFKQILSALSDGYYRMGGFVGTPSLVKEMIIKLSDGREVIIREIQLRPRSALPFLMVYVERKLYPQEMMMESHELRLIFDDFADSFN